MTKAYSKISGYNRPHVYVLVSDKKFPLWRAFSKISGYGRKIRWIRVDASRIRKKKFVFSQISRYVWTMPKTPITLSYLYIVERFGYGNSGLFKDSKQKYSKVVVTGNLHPLNAN